MWFIIILAILFLLYYFAPRIILAVMRYVMRRQAEKFFGPQQREGGKWSRKTGWQGFSQQEQPRSRRKKIGRDVGEYVEFTELPPDGSRQESAPVSFTPECRVEDAEWTDIN